MTVVICQQDNFLQYLLEPYLSGKNIKIEYRKGHHSEVARAVVNKEVDFVITHKKVKALQKLEAEGRLGKGRTLFANPMVFLGPKGDPAGIKGLSDPVLAVRKILESEYCFVVNNHGRLKMIQEKLLEQSQVKGGCVIRNEENEKLTAMDVAFKKNAYTLWGLHPYAQKSENRLEAILIPDKSLLESMNGWVVSGTDVGNDAKELLNYLDSEEVEKKISEFRLAGYKDIQAWWPVDN